MKAPRRRAAAAIAERSAGTVATGLSTIAPMSGQSSEPSGAANRGLLLVISGPSGVGKTTIVHEIVRRFDGVFSVSATTRAPGPRERDGVDYWFIDRERFQKWIDEDRFLEVAQVFGGNWYGTPAEPVDRAVAEGRVAVLDIDVQGAESVRRKRPDAFAIFILPPDADELLRRLRERGREDEAAIERRFAEAQREIERAHLPKTYDAFVVNDDLASAVDEVERLVRERRGTTTARWQVPQPSSPPRPPPRS